MGKEVKYLIKIQIIYFTNIGVIVYFYFAQMILGMLKTNGANVVLTEMSCATNGYPPHSASKTTTLPAELKELSTRLNNRWYLI